MQMRPLQQVFYILFQRRTALETGNIQAVDDGTFVEGQRKSRKRAQGNFEGGVNG